MKLACGVFTTVVQLTDVVYVLGLPLPAVDSLFVVRRYFHYGRAGTTVLTPNTHRRRRRDATIELSRVGGVNAPVGSRDPVYNSAAMFIFQIFDQIRRQSSWASCEFSTHRATSEHFDATQLDSCVASAVCIGLSWQSLIPRTTGPLAAGRTRNDRLCVINTYRLVHRPRACCVHTHKSSRWSTDRRTDGPPAGPANRYRDTETPGACEASSRCCSRVCQVFRLRRFNSVDKYGGWFVQLAATTPTDPQFFTYRRRRSAAECRAAAGVPALISMPRPWKLPKIVKPREELWWSRNPQCHRFHRWIVVSEKPQASRRYCNESGRHFRTLRKMDGFGVFGRNLAEG